MKYQSPPHQQDNRLSKQKPKGKSISTYDRHIRRVDKEQYTIRSTSPTSSSSSSSYHSELEESLLKDKPLREYTLSKRDKRLSHLNTESSRVKRLTKPMRKFRIAGWTDNFYSTLLDWSYSNFICVAVNQSLFFYNMALQAEEDEFDRGRHARKYQVSSGSQKINSIHLSPTTTKIAIGYSEGSLICYDYFKDRACSDLQPHCERISSIEWYGNSIYTASKDKTLKCFDARTMRHSRTFPKDHSQEICGVKAHANYLATGGNDNQVHIYDIRRPEHYLSKYHHSAAVKALDWVVPNVLVSGGGNGDRKIKFWKDGQGIIREFDTGSQVCGVIASINSSEILSCQGFSLNQIVIWNIEGKRELTVHGHRNRVLFCALSPGGQYVATGAGDERLKIWKFFESGTYKDWSISDIR